MVWRALARGQNVLSAGRSVGRSFCRSAKHRNKFCPSEISKTAKFHGLRMCPTPPHMWGLRVATGGSFALNRLLYRVKNQIHCIFWAFRPFSIGRGVWNTIVPLPTGTHTTLWAGYVTDHPYCGDGQSNGHSAGPRRAG